MEKRYGLVIVNDYSRWTWVRFLAHKDESLSLSSLYYVKEFKMKKKHVVLQLEVIMGENLRMKISKFFVRKMVSSTTIQHLEHLNKMG